MNKNEFVEYIEHLDKLFGMNNTNDTEIMKTWYKSFENTNLITAKEMAQMYLEEEQGRFKLAKLLQYKSKALAGKIYHDNSEKQEQCPYCNETGYIQVETPYRSSYTIVNKRCLCRIGQGLNRSIKQITAQEIKEGDFRNGVIRKPEFHSADDIKAENITQFNNLFYKK